MEYKRSDCEFLRIQMNEQFNHIKPTMYDLMYWTLPHRSRFLSGGRQQGPRNNNHIVDVTHLIGLRSYVAGFLEGNTSTSRPWIRYEHHDPAMRRLTRPKEWIDKLTWRVHAVLNNSNFYHALAESYYDFGVANTAVLFIEELKPFGLHFTVLPPGSYRIQNDAKGRANILIREFKLNIKSLVEEYGERKNGKPDWSNFSDRVKRLYEKGTYSEEIEVVNIIKPNNHFDRDQMELGPNRPWVSITYESPTNASGSKYQYDAYSDASLVNKDGTDKFLRVGYMKRKPFIAYRSSSTNNYAYGETGPTYQAIGMIKALNKKRLTKDIALEQMVKPTTMGPASIRKNYVTTIPGANVPLTPTEASLGGLKKIFEIDPAIGALIQDTNDERATVGKLYFQDYLLFLTQNPKTRTAEETRAVVSEQQLVIGPNLQSLNWTLNRPSAEYVAEYVLDEDPFLEPPPLELAGSKLEPTFISIFAQAQKSADLPNINQFLSVVANLAPMNASIIDKLDVDILADLYDDRLFLPPGLVRSKGNVDGMREKREAEFQQQQKLEALPAVAGAAKDLNLQQK